MAIEHHPDLVEAIEELGRVLVVHRHMQVLQLLEDLVIHVAQLATGARTMRHAARQRHALAGEGLDDLLQELRRLAARGQGQRDQVVV